MRFGPGLHSFLGDVGGELRGEVVERHHTEVVVAPGAHGNGPVCLLLVADDEDVRDLLQRMLAYFIGDFLVPQIARDSKSLFLQRFGHFPGVIG